MKGTAVIQTASHLAITDLAGTVAFLVKSAIGPALLSGFVATALVMFVLSMDELIDDSKSIRQRLLDSPLSKPSAWTMIAMFFGVANFVIGFFAKITTFYTELGFFEAGAYVFGYIVLACMVAAGIIAVAVEAHKKIHFRH